MKALASIEIHYLLKEMQFLAGAKIDRIYNPSEKELLLQFHVPNKGKKIVRITDKFFYLANIKEDNKEPTGFCMFLRNHLDNSRLKSIRQPGSERIVEFSFETKEGKKTLIAEFFGSGNTILCDEKNIILSAAEFRKFKDREIGKGIEYIFPKKEMNLFDIGIADIKKFASSTEKGTLVKALAVDLGLGGIYSEEVCSFSKLDKKKNPKDLSGKELELIASSIKKIINEKTEAQVIYENDKIVDSVPFGLDIYKNNKKSSFETFSEALEFYFSNTSSKDTKHDRQIEKLKNIIEIQKSKIEELNGEEKENREKAELIYNKYQLVSEILTEINKAKEKHGWEEIRNKLKGHKIVKEVNTKDKVIVVEI